MKNSGADDWPVVPSTEAEFPVAQFSINAK